MKITVDISLSSKENYLVVCVTVTRYYLYNRYLIHRYTFRKINSILTINIWKKESIGWFRFYIPASRNIGNLYLIYISQQKFNTVFSPQ